MTGHVTVIGSGVSGLTTAVELQDRGHAVTLLTAEPPRHTTSAVAAAIWHPFFQSPDPLYMRRAAATRARLTALPGASGVRVRTLTEFFAGTDEAPWWARDLTEGEPAVRADCPPRYASAWSVRVPVADTSRYLSWLSDGFEARGGRVERRLVTDPAAEVSRAGPVVNCAGFGSAALTGDHGMSLVRGVVLRCAKPEGLDGCWIDDSDPLRPTYVIERESDVVLGGTADPGLVATAVPEETLDDILARCAALVPAVLGARVLDVKVGFRPMRGSARVERDPDIPGLVHNYGHGGAGFTLSWGCAAEAADLLHTPQQRESEPQTSCSPET